MEKNNTLLYKINTDVRHTLFLCLIVVCFCVPVYAGAADIRSTNALPNEDAVFFDTDNITFLGGAENMTSDSIVQGGWADVEIDWNTDGSFDNLNAYNGLVLGNFSPGGVRPLEKTVTGPLPLGNHRYRFNVDTTDMLTPESDEANNRSAWVNFSVIATPYAPVITLSSASNPITAGDTTQLTWNTTYAAACTKSSVPSGWNGSGVSGSEPVSPATTTIYTLDCTSAGGSASKSFTINVSTPPPAITFNATPNPVNAGVSSQLTWTVADADTCTASGPLWIGLKSNTGNSEFVTPTTTSTYTLTCTGPGGTGIKSQVINVNPPLPVITFTATPSTIPLYGTTSLDWNVVGANFCRAYDSWSGVKAIPSGSQFSSPQGTAVYTLSCGNLSGTTTSKITVTVTGGSDLTNPAEFAGVRITNHISSTSLSVNATTTFRAKVRNIGTATTSGSFFDRFRYRWGFGTWYPLGSTIPRTALGPGQAHEPYDESVVFAFDREGFNEIEHCVDNAPPQITETAEGNNCTWYSFSARNNSPGAPKLDMTQSDRYHPAVANSNWLYYILNRITIGSSSTIRWTSTSTTNCDAFSDIGDPKWSGTKPSSGVLEVSPNRTANYTLTCTGPGGMVVKSVRIYITITPPQITSFTATQNPVPRGQMAQLNWTATSSEYCVGSGGWSGSKNRVLGSESVGPINTPMTFTLTCTSVTGSDGIGGIVIKNLQVDPYDPPPDITIGVSPNPITPVATDFSTLSWTVSKDTSCNAYANGVYMSSHTYGNAGGSHNESVSPDITTTYMLTCAGLGGTTTKSVTLTVSEIAPIISISASDNTIIEDDSTMLTWSVLGATSCVASGGSDGWDALSSADLLAGGPKSVTPSADTTYTLTCIGPWGEHTLPVTVYVLPKAQITNFELCTVGVGAVCMRPSDTTELTPWTINPGTPLEIDWEANPSTATFCSAIDGNGFITSSAIAGTQNLNATALPNVADEYTIACGTAGLLTNSATIYIATNPVAPDITISPRILPPGGGELKVSWDTNNGDQSVCSVNGGGLSGLLPSTGTDVGEATLSIYGRTTFTVTCGSETDSVTVELSPTLWES